MGITRKAVILKESRGQHPTHHSLNSLKTMTELNTDYNNTELLDQELTTAELLQVSGGCGDATNTIMDPGFSNLPGVVGEFMKFLPLTLIATLSASLAISTCRFTVGRAIRRISDISESVLPLEIQ